MRPGSTTLRLAANLDICAARPLADELVARIGQPLSLDASGVERLGGLCLQVLLSARAEWERGATPIVVENPSDAFVGALARFGATPFSSGREDLP